MTLQGFNLRTFAAPLKHINLTDIEKKILIEFICHNNGAINSAALLTKFSPENPISSATLGNVNRSGYCTAKTYDTIFKAILAYYKQPTTA